MLRNGYVLLYNDRILETRCATSLMPALTRATESVESMQRISLIPRNRNAGGSAGEDVVFVKIASKQYQ